VVHPRNRWRNRKSRLRVPRLANRNVESLFGSRDARWIDDDGVPVFAIFVTGILIPPHRSHAAAVPTRRDDNDKTPSGSEREASLRDRVRGFRLSWRKELCSRCVLYTYCG